MNKVHRLDVPFGDQEPATDMGRRPNGSDVMSGSFFIQKQTLVHRAQLCL